MKGRIFGLTENAKSRDSDGKETGNDDDRAVRFVPDGHNSWRVVWADN